MSLELFVLVLLYFRRLPSFKNVLLFFRQDVTLVVFVDAQAELTSICLFVVDSVAKLHYCL